MMSGNIGILNNGLFYLPYMFVSVLLLFNEVKINRSREEVKASGI